MSFVPSIFQKNIFDFIVDGEGNAVINAVAGSGKTTTLLEALKMLPKDASIMFLAFNKSIKTEIQEKVNDLGLTNVTVNTCHGFGFSSLLSSLENKPSIDNLKYRKMIRNVISFIQSGDLTPILDYKFKANEIKICQAFDIDWESMDDKYEFTKRVIQLVDLGRMFLKTTTKSIKKISKKYNIVCSGNEAELASALIKLGKTFVSTIDFADMIYLPNELKLTTQKFDYVFIDECQDLNTAQRELMLKSLYPSSRFIAVGDKNQAIYGFAGADAESFNKLTKLPNTISLPLSVCYRCGSDIVKKAQNIVPDIQPFDKNKSGVVDLDGSINDIIDGDMVLCRNTYPLVKLCLAFLKDGKKATIMGGDIGKSLINMVKEANQKDMNKVFDKLYHNLELVFKRILRAEECTDEEARQNTEYVNYEEKIQVIEAIYTVGDDALKIISKLEDIFNDFNKEGIILSTIHKSKGLESNRVFIIHPEKMPSKFAKQKWELTQENNLRYVAYTRAKSLLSIVTDFDAYSGRDGETFANKINEVKISQHIGKVGSKHKLEGTIVECRYISNYNSMVYVIEDKKGNIFEKWGDIKPRFVVSNDNSLKEGTLIRANVTISKHSEFRGIKKNGIKNFGIY